VLLIFEKEQCSENMEHVETVAQNEVVFLFHRIHFNTLLGDHRDIEGKARGHLS